MTHLYSTVVRILGIAYARRARFMNEMNRCAVDMNINFPCVTYHQYSPIKPMFFYQCDTRSR